MPLLLACILLCTHDLYLFFLLTLHLPAEVAAAAVPPLLWLLLLLIPIEKGCWY